MRTRLRAGTAIAASVIVAGIAIAAIAMVGWRRETDHQIMNLEGFTLNDLVDGATRRIQLNPRDWEAYMSRARHYQSLEQFELAEADLQEVLKSAHSGDVLREAHRNLGLGYLEQQQFEEAAEAFSAALATSASGDTQGSATATDGHLFEWRAAAHYYMRDHDLSLTDCQSAIDAGNTTRQVRQLQAMNHVKLRNWEAALKSLESVPDDVRVLMLRAYALAGLGRNEEAIKARRAARAIDAAIAERWEGFVPEGETGASEGEFNPLNDPGQG